MVLNQLPPAPRAQRIFNGKILGLAPQALCYRPLRGLSRRSATSVQSKMIDLDPGVLPQAAICERLRRFAFPQASLIVVWVHSPPDVPADSALEGKKTRA
jgi:hypothetical protein